jgi:aspirochlorine biosynthesis cytochrome P450 monooxygenase
VYKKLMNELITTFPMREGIDMATVQYLPYLNAVLEESLRVYPPSAFNQARVVPNGGAIICGEVVPGGTAVAVGTLAAFTSKRNWVDPEQFIPERWLGEGFVGDDRRVLQPFITGPRNCIGKK